MSGYFGHNTTGRGNEIAARRARHNFFSSGSNSNAYPLNMDVIFNPKKNNAMNEFRAMVKSNKNVGNEWKKAHDNAAKKAVYPKATFKNNATRQKFEGKSTNTTTTKKKRKTVKKRLVKINNNKNKKKNNKNSNKKRVTNKMNKTKMGGRRRRNTTRKNRKRRKR